MDSEYTVKFDKVTGNSLIQEIEANVQDIKDSFGKLEKLTNTLNRMQKFTIPDALEPFIRKYYEIPAEKREMYLTCFSSEEQDKIRSYVKIKEKKLKITSFEDEVGKTIESINLLMRECKELQKNLPSIQRRTNRIRSHTPSITEKHEKMAYAKIEAFTFEGQMYDVRNWTDYLLQLCALLYQKHPDKFSQIVSFARPRGGVFFSHDPESCIRALPISDSGIYVEANMSATKIYKRSFDVIQFFGYSSEDLSVKYQELR